jgi:hypothetical protein
LREEEVAVRLRKGALMIVLAVAVGMATASLQAHHSVANFWQADTVVSVTGVVTKVLLANPHPTIFLDVTEGGQTVKYVAILGQSVAGLAGFGITKDTFAAVAGAATKVVLEGHPPKAEGSTTKGILVNALTLPDGKRIALGEAGLGLR